MTSMCFQPKRDSFPSAPRSGSEDDDLPSVKKIIARAGRAQLAIDLTGDDPDHDIVVNLQRKSTQRLAKMRS
jgi:hypothetical protein